MSLSRHLPAAVIAEALGVSKPTVHRRAVAEQWPAVPCGNRWEYQPPADVLALVEAAASAADDATEEVEALRVKYADLTHSDAQRAQVLAKEQAVRRLAELARSHGRETALQLVCTEFADTLKCLSVTSLRDWEKRFAKYGLDGLVQQKKGVVGPKGCAAQLTPEQVLRGKAMAYEHGSVARAARNLMVDLNLAAGVREHLHGAHMSKSYVPPSIREALRPNALTAALLQGPKAARLDGAFTPGKYDQLKAGEWFTADDMTSNVLCWVEASNARGWRIAQAQILPVLDIGSLRWLNVRVIVREGGQYSADDIWGLFGDVFDTFGLPTRGFLLEGGHWQANRVAGHRTGLSDEERMGGLRSLGLEMDRSYDPRSKVIETRFNQLQYVFDACPGYAGRDQRKQLPEKLKQQVARAEGGHLHPREFLLHVSELANRVQAAMEQLNHERQDGVILRGQSPLEKWAEHAPRLASLPDSAKWLYRSTMNVTQWTRNGLRVTVGSGKKEIVHYYDNPHLTVTRRGQKAVVYWNDRNPEADACVLDFATRQFLGLAKWVQPLERFGATDEQLATEARRKAAHIHEARTEARAIQPYAQRSARPEIPSSPSTDRVGDELRAAIERTEQATARRAEQKRTARQHGPAAAADLLASDEPAEDLGSRVSDPGPAPHRAHAPDLLAELS